MHFSFKSELICVLFVIMHLRLSAELLRLLCSVQCVRDQVHQCDGCRCCSVSCTRSMWSCCGARCGFSCSCVRIPTPALRSGRGAACNSCCASYTGEYLSAVRSSFEGFNCTLSHANFYFQRTSVRVWSLHNRNTFQCQRSRQDTQTACVGGGEPSRDGGEHHQSADRWDAQENTGIHY